MIVILGARLSFYNDDWYFIFQRPGFSAESILEPHNGHLSALPVLAYKGLIEAFGLGNQVPFRILLAFVVVSLAVLVYVFVQARAGRLLALLAAATLLFLGPAWEDLLWTFQVGLIGSLASGVGVLLALERDTPRRNLVACLLLVLSISLSNLGVSFVFAAAIAVLVRRRFSQLWIPALPALLFAVWLLSYGQGTTYGLPGAGADLSLSGAAQAPVFIIDAIGSALASIAGLSEHATGGDPSGWGRPLLVICAAGVVAWALRGGRPHPRLLVVAAAAFSFWFLAGASGRAPFESRYQLISATFVILMAAELFRPVRLRPEALAAVAALTLVAIGANLGALSRGYDLMRHHSDIARADLGALEIAAPHAPPTFQLLGSVAQTPVLTAVTAGAYLRETAAHGSPPRYSPAQLAEAPPELQRAADHVLAAGYEIRLEPRPAPSRSPTAVRCHDLPAGPGGPAREHPLAPGTVRVTNTGGTPALIGVRRFAPPKTAVPLGTVAGSFTIELDIPDDDLELPWHLTAGEGPLLEVCS